MSNSITRGVINIHTRLEDWRDSEEDSDTGDSTTYYNTNLGDCLQEHKCEGTTQLYFQNLNGIKWDDQGGTWPMICQAMLGTQADIIGFAEINQDTTKYEVKYRIETIAKKYFDQRKIVTSTGT